MRDHYHGHAAARYDHRWGDFTRHMLFPIRTLVLDHAPTSASVLDVGCGTGVLLTWLAQAHSDLQLWGTDESPAMLAQAAQRLGDQAHLLRWDLDQPPPPVLVAAAPFAHIICTNVLHYVANPMQVIAQLGRWLAPGGTVYLADFIQHGWWWPLFEGLLHLTDRGHRQTLTAEAIVDMVRMTPLTVISTQRINAGGPWRGVMVVGCRRT